MSTNSVLTVNEHNRRLMLADFMLSRHEFGEGVSVVDSDNWDPSEVADWVKILYVNFDDQEKDADTVKVSFHVRFNDDHTVAEAYALEHSKGEMLGNQPTTELETESKRPKFG